MKKQILLSLITLMSSPETFAADKILWVEPMFCNGQIQGQSNAVDPSYYQMLMKLESFRSRRRDGSLAPSSEVTVTYFNQDEQIDPKTEDYHEKHQMQPIRIDGDRVYLKGLTGRDDDLELTVTSRKKENSTERLELEGTYNKPETVAGSYYYQMKCQATVVKVAQRIVDLTRKRNFCPQVTDLESATQCMKDVAKKTIPEIEEPNSIGVSNSKDAFQAIQEIYQEDRGSTLRLRKIAYVAVVKQHDDEHRLYYFLIQNGTNVEPRKILEINVADIADYLPKNAAKPGNWSLNISNIEGWDYDEFEQIRRNLNP